MKEIPNRPKCGLCGRDKILLNENFKYVIHFLKNGGERMRAIKLTVDAADISIKQAKNWVDNLCWRKRSTQNPKHGLDWNGIGLD